MPKPRRPDPRHLARERLLFRYSSALERGDFETISTILREAERDALLDRMIRELDEAYGAESLMLPAITYSSNHVKAEDQHMTSAQITTMSGRAASLRRPTFTTTWPLLVASMAALLLSALLLLPRPGGSIPALLQGEASPTFVPTPSMTHSATPLPAVVSPLDAYDYITVEALDGIPANTSIGILNRANTQNGVVYTVTDADGNIALAREWQISQNPNFYATFVPTPTAQFAFTMGVGGYDLMTLEDVGNITANTPVRAVSAMLIGGAWVYTITAADGRIAEARESQLTYTPVLCEVINASQNPVPLASSNDAGALSSVNGLLPLQTVASVIDIVYRQDGDWYSVRAIVDGVTVAGWVKASQVGQITPCPSLAAALTPTPTFTATPIPVQSNPLNPQAMWMCSIYSETDLGILAGPSADAVGIGLLPASILAEVSETEVDVDGQTWYLIRVPIDRGSIMGWLRADTVIALEQCPEANVLPATVMPPINLNLSSTPIMWPVVSATPTASLTWTPTPVQ